MSYTKNPLTGTLSKAIATYTRHKYIEQRTAFSQQGLLLDLQRKFFKNKHIGNMECKNIPSSHSKLIEIKKENRVISLLISVRSDNPMIVNTVSVEFRQYF